MLTGMPVTVKDILKEWLIENNCEGLCAEDFSCVCDLDDLMTCTCENFDLPEGVRFPDTTECLAAFKVPCDNEFHKDCDHHITVLNTNFGVKLH